MNTVVKSPTFHEIANAAAALAAGRLVAFPTETVYGLGADAENPQAVASIYTAKGRPSNHPVIVHLAPEADLSHWVAEIPEPAQRLINAFWPGPLTLILKRAAHIPDAVSGGQDSIGVRCPSHPVAQALLRAFKHGQGGIAAPSANQFGHVSPTTAQHVRDEFPDELVLGGALASVLSVLDGGQSEVGIESTIVDLTRIATHGVVVLRPGHITTEQLGQVLGESLITTFAPDVSAPRASGTLEAHYAPRTPVALIASAELPHLVQQLRYAAKTVAIMCHQSHTSILTLTLANRQLPSDPVLYAHDLYASLRELDAANADIILAEALPASKAWQGVNDRLRRAAFDSQGILHRLLTK